MKFKDEDIDGFITMIYRNIIQMENIVGTPCKRLVIGYDVWNAIVAYNGSIYTFYSISPVTYTMFGLPVTIDYHNPGIVQFSVEEVVNGKNI